MAEADLHSLGMMLRQARESRALSLEEVEAQTRIRVKYLRALESGDFSELPSAAHARGFLRNYAQFLRLDANAIVAYFAELTGSEGGAITTVTAPSVYEVPPPPGATTTAVHQMPAAPQPAVSAPLSTPPVTGGASRPIHITPAQRIGPAVPRVIGKPVPQPSEVPDQPRRGRRILRSNVFAGIVLLAGFALIVWWVVTRLSSVSIEDIVPTPEQSEFLQTFAARSAATPSPTFIPTDTPLPEVGIPILGRVLLTITVEQRTWAIIIVDGQTRFEGQAEPGTVLQFEGLQTILLRAGNGAGLLVTYNGQNIGRLGERGEVVERIFTPSGQSTPTPTPTVTPTFTPVPTPTQNISPTP